jgi:uncharacterized cupin superfamily protein
MKLVRTKDQPWVDAMNQGHYVQRKKPLAGQALGCSLWELAPGKKSFPFHVHYVTEEAMYVVSGSAKVRTPEGETPIGPGDYISFLAGAGAHQLINDGTEPLVYLGMSASKGVDVVEYPDSNKVAAAVGVPPDGKRFMFKKDSQVGYFEGEKDAG